MGRPRRKNTPQGVDLPKREQVADRGEGQTGRCPEMGEAAFDFTGTHTVDGTRRCEAAEEGTTKWALQKGDASEVGNERRGPERPESSREQRLRPGLNLWGARSGARLWPWEQAAGAPVPGLKVW